MHTLNDINLHPESFHSQDKEHKQLLITKYFKTLCSFQILGQGIMIYTSNQSPTSSLLCADRKFSDCNLVESRQYV